jgi:hypothetical protein
VVTLTLNQEAVVALSGCNRGTTSIRLREGRGDLNAGDLQGLSTGIPIVPIPPGSTPFQETPSSPLGPLAARWVSWRRWSK